MFWLHESLVRRVQTCVCVFQTAQNSSTLPKSFCRYEANKTGRRVMLQQNGNVCNYIESMCSLVVASANSKSTTLTSPTWSARRFALPSTPSPLFSLHSFDYVLLPTQWEWEWQNAIYRVSVSLPLYVCKFKMTMISFSFGYFIGLQCWILFSVTLSTKLNNSKRPAGLKFIHSI